MDQEKTEKGKFEHFCSRCTQIEIAKPLLELFIVLEKLEYFEYSQYSKQSIQSRNPCQSRQFVHPSVCFVTKENLGRERC